MPRIFSSDRVERDSEGRYILSLNREFFRGKEGQPELLVKVLCPENGSGILEEYIRFARIFDEQMAEHKEEKDRAIREIFRICMEENVLREYLSGHRGEVEKIMLTMLSPEYIEMAELKSARIREAIKTLKRFGHGEQEIMDFIIKEYDLTPGYAQNWMEAIEEEEEEGILE